MCRLHENHFAFALKAMTRSRWQGRRYLSCASSTSKRGINFCFVPSVKTKRSFVQQVFQICSSEKPVCCATTFRSICLPNGLLRNVLSISLHGLLYPVFPPKSGRSKRPGRSNAGSSTSERFVAAITMMSSLPEKPSISTNS